MEDLEDDVENPADTPNPAGTPVEAPAAMRPDSPAAPSTPAEVAAQVADQLSEDAAKVRPRPLSEIPMRAPVRRASRPGPRMEEAKPWEAYNSDGSPNPGSYAAGAARDLLFLAHKEASMRMRAVRDAGGDETISMAQVMALAKALLTAADKAQASSRPDARHDRMDPSHRGARDCIRESLWMLPTPWGSTPTERDAWQDELAEHAGLLMRMAVDLFLADQ